ncbi:MAG: hypothetical protein Q8S84_08735 [bacterium]|nr:hypothetical protein [bacterium]MDP3381514.1 hypothetical protein [bacterium]
MYSTFVIFVSQLAINHAITIAAHALKSQDVTVEPHLKLFGQKINASCGFIMAKLHFIFSNSTKKLSLHSNNTSCILLTHSA